MRVESERSLEVVFSPSEKGLVANCHDQMCFHPRMVTHQVTSSMTDAMSQNIIQQGFLQNLTIDYFDVDTDPMMKFESGYPYRTLTKLFAMANPNHQLVSGN